jgi:hypothetical protein
MTDRGVGGGRILSIVVLFAFSVVAPAAPKADKSSNTATNQQGAQIQVRKPPIYTSPLRVNVNRVLVNITIRSTKRFSRLTTQTLPYRLG